MFSEPKSICQPSTSGVNVLPAQKTLTTLQEEKQATNGSTSIGSLNQTCTSVSPNQVPGNASAPINCVNIAFSPTLITVPSAIPLYPSINASEYNENKAESSLHSRYNQLLAVIEEMSKDLKPVYSGSKPSLDRFKRGIAQARLLTRECQYQADLKINPNKVQQASTSSQFTGCK